MKYICIFTKENAIHVSTLCTLNSLAYMAFESGAHSLNGFWKEKNSVHSNMKCGEKWTINHRSGRM